MAPSRTARIDSPSCGWLTARLAAFHHQAVCQHSCGACIAGAAQSWSAPSKLTRITLAIAHKFSRRLTCHAGTSDAEFARFLEVQNCGNASLRDCNSVPTLHGFDVLPTTDEGFADDHGVSQCTPHREAHSANSQTAVEKPVTTLNLNRSFSHDGSRDASDQDSKSIPKCVMSLPTFDEVYLSPIEKAEAVDELQAERQLREMKQTLWSATDEQTSLPGSPQWDSSMNPGRQPDGQVLREAKSEAESMRRAAAASAQFEQTAS